MSKKIKESFIFYRSFFESISLLPEEEQLGIFKAICDMALNETKHELDGMQLAIYKLVEPQLLANNRRYKNACKGGRPKNQKETKAKPKKNQKETKAKPKKNQSETKPKANDNDNDNDNKNEKVKVNKAKANSQDEVVNYCLELGLAEADGIATWEKWNGNGWINGKAKIKDWKATVRSWKASGYMPSQKNPALRATSRTSPQQSAEVIGELEQF